IAVSVEIGGVGPVVGDEAVHLARQFMSHEGGPGSRASVQHAAPEWLDGAMQLLDAAGQRIREGGGEEWAQRACLWAGQRHLRRALLELVVTGGGEEGEGEEDGLHQRGS